MAGFPILSVMLLVPLLENYAFAALLLIAAALFMLFYFGIKSANPLLNLLVVAFTLIPVAGVLEQDGTFTNGERRIPRAILLACRGWEVENRFHRAA